MYELTVITKGESFAPLRNVFGKRGVKVVNEETSKKIHMFYPVKNERYGFLNVLRFEGTPEMIADITSDLKLEGEVLRFMVTKMRPAGVIEEQEVATPPLRREVSRTAPSRPAEPTLTNEELERKIEEILK